MRTYVSVKELITCQLAIKGNTIIPTKCKRLVKIKKWRKLFEPSEPDAKGGMFA